MCFVSGGHHCEENDNIYSGIRAQEAVEHGIAAVNSF